MSTNLSLMDIYVSEVGRHLFGKRRADIQAEIRSTLQDMLEERSRKAGKPIDEEMTLEVLKEYGAPEKVASSYLGERYLIGPRLYPLFMLVLRIVLTVLGILAAIGLGITIYQASLTGQGIFEAILKAIENFAFAIISMLGSMVLAFGLLEWAFNRSGKEVDLKDLSEKEWDSRSLTRLTPANQVKPGEMIIGIVGSFAAIVLFNSYPQFFGIGIGSGGIWYVGAGNLTVVLLLSKTFFSYVPYLTAVWAMTIILNIILMSTGTWTTLTRACLIGLKIVNILIAAEMLAGPSLLALTPASMTTLLGNAEWASSLMTSLNLLVRVLLWLSILGNGIEIIQVVSRLATNNLLPQFSGKSS